MTNKNKAFFRQFFELNIKNSICKLWLAIQIKQVKTDETTLAKMEEITQKSKELESKIADIIVNHKDIFESVNLTEIARYQENWVAVEKQKAFAKELLGYEITVDKLLEQAKN